MRAVGVSPEIIGCFFCAALSGSLLCFSGAATVGLVGSSAGWSFRVGIVSVTLILLLPADIGDASVAMLLHWHFFQHFNTDFTLSDFAQSGHGWFVF